MYRNYILKEAQMLKGKNVILGVTGSIAAYKIASLASSLVKLNCNVDVIMTQNAVNFINPITFDSHWQQVYSGHFRQKFPVQC